MLRIVADLNDIDQYGRTTLTELAIERAALEDRTPLEVGMTVMLYGEDDFEVKAVLDYQEKTKTWVASPIWSTFRDFSKDWAIRQGLIDSKR